MWAEELRLPAALPPTSGGVSQDGAAGLCSQSLWQETNLLFPGDCFAERAVLELWKTWKDFLQDWTDDA